MTATIEVKDESYKQREAEKERRQKAEDFGPSYIRQYGNRPSVQELETLRQNYELHKERAENALYYYKKCKEWDDRYERMKREELGE